MDSTVTGQTDWMRSAERVATDERDPPPTPPWMTKNKLAVTTGLAREPAPLFHWAVNTSGWGWWAESPIKTLSAQRSSSEASERSERAAALQRSGGWASRFPLLKI